MSYLNDCSNLFLAAIKQQLLCRDDGSMGNHGKCWICCAAQVVRLFSEVSASLTIIISEEVGYLDTRSKTCRLAKVIIVYMTPQFLLYVFCSRVNGRKDRNTPAGQRLKVLRAAESEHILFLTVCLFMLTSYGPLESKQL